MFAALAIGLCISEIAFPHFYGAATDDIYYFYWQVQFVAICLLAVVSNSGQRDKSVLSIVLLWETWLVINDMLVDYTGPIRGSMEATAFTVLIVWALVRPYFFASDRLSKDTVCVAFYRGDRAPALSSLAALIGLPFSSVAIIIGDIALRASKNGRMVASNSQALANNDFVFVDTKIKITQKISSTVIDCVGNSTKSIGLLRTKCLFNLAPVLKEIGYEPKTIFHKIPSIFYSQCLRQAHG